MPLGEIDPKTLAFLARGLRETFRCEVVVADRMPVPEMTFDPRRGQFHATRILERLGRLDRTAGEPLLAVIDEDLYVPELNFVFGEADMPERIAVIGLARLRQEYYGLDPDEELFLLRASKEAVHELGHTLGLGHCPDRNCVMHFSNSLKDTDVKEAAFCEACGNALEGGRREDEGDGATGRRFPGKKRSPEKG